MKNIKYSLGAKIVAAGLAWICFIAATGSGFYLLSNQDEVTSQNYYESSSFQMDFYDLIHNVAELNALLINEETVRASGEEQNVINYSLIRLHNIKKNLSATNNFFYYIRNTETQEEITNIKSSDEIDYIQGMPIHVYFSELESEYTTRYQYYDINSMLIGTNLELYATVQNPLQPGDTFYDSYQTYNVVKANVVKLILVEIVSLVLFFFSFIYLILVSGRRESGGKIHLIFVDRIFTEIHFLLVFIAAIISLSFLTQFSYYNSNEFLMIGLIVLAIDFWIGMSYFFSMVRQIKGKLFITNSLSFKLLKALKKFIKMCFDGKIFKVSLLLLLLAYGGINSLIFALSISGDEVLLLFGFIFLICFNTFVLIFSSRSLASLSTIMESTEELSKGNLDYKLDTSKISVSFSNFAEDVQSIQMGLKKAVAEAIKGERMKTDLITNVSHDLKTPLTSIVTYVDLLKKEELSNDTANGYIEILEEKSYRLKNLIEDLIEASKASSGNLNVNAEKVDLHELMLQACGEYEESIKASDLDIRINSELSVLVIADGKYMWRIVENLMSNAIKYSLKHSRVYIDIIETDTHGQITVKNISATALDISPEQLTERFVRGEASRTTEGSGLGLSIAQSLSVLQGGTFKIEIDGDLYKATVALPLWPMQEKNEE